MAPKVPQLRLGLPKLELAKFDGELNQWESFWMSFRAHIHDDVNIPKVTKFQYLSSVLKGTPSLIVNNYHATDTGYDGAIAALLEHYDDRDKQIEFAINKLYDIKEPSFTLAGVLAFKVAIEGLNNDLQYLKINMKGEAQPFVQHWLLRKMPVALKQRVYTESKLYPTVDEIVKALSIIIKKNDFQVTESNLKCNEFDDEVSSKPVTAVVNSLVVNKSSAPRKGSNRARGKSPNSPQLVKSKEVKIPTGKSVQTSSQVIVRGRLACIYCNGGHNSNTCRKVPGDKSREQRLESRGICPKCCRFGHNAKCCNTRIYPCYRCGGRHYTWRCTVRKHTPTPGTSPTKSPLETTTGVRAHPKQAKTTSSSTLLSLANTDRANLDSTALPTARITVCRGKMSCQVRTFFDQGSQRSFIAERLVKDLAVPVNSHIEMEVAGFNSITPAQVYGMVKMDIIVKKRREK